MNFLSSFWFVWSRRSHRRSSRQAYTLVEILVVIAITSTLAAILVPVLGRVREKGRQSVCVSNLHQLGLAAQMYFSDYDGKRPFRFEGLQKAGYVKERDLDICPDDSTGNFGGLIYESTRPQSVPPETLKHSYSSSFELFDWEWDALLRWGPKAGMMACQMHGEGTPSHMFDTQNNHEVFTPVHSDYEGLILRLQMDGAVVTRHTKWPRVGRPDNTFPLGNQWMLYCDDVDAHTDTR